MSEDIARRVEQERSSMDDPLIGKVLAGRFEVVAPIARGGMGKVYRAVQRPLGRPVALKVLDVKGVVSPRADFQRRFFLEAATAAKLTHPNTVVVYDYGVEQDDVYFIAMEFIEGRTLTALLKEVGPLDALRVVHIGRQIAGSLGEAHAQGVVHRDLKPSNVLLTRRGTDDAFVKVLDFGLVKVLSDEPEGGDLTQSGVMMGTPRYMSPEQVTGTEVTPASDIYALGALLYHALTGRPPFDGQSKFEIFTAHVTIPPMPLRDAYPLLSAPARLERLVLRCLAKRPVDRPRSMEEVEHELVQVEREIRANPLAFGVNSANTTLPRLAWSGVTTPESASRIPRAAPAGDSRGEGRTPPPVEIARIATAATVLRHDDPLFAGGAAPPAILVEPGPGVGDSSAHGSGASDSAQLSNRFALPREPPSSPRPARTASAWTAATVGLVLFGGVGVFAYQRVRQGSDAAADETPPTSVAPTPQVPRIDEANRSGAGALAAPVVIDCNVRARMRRGGVDLGDCGAPLPVPPGEAWEVELSAQGYVTRTLTVFGGQGRVPARLEPRFRGGGGARGSGGRTVGGSVGTADGNEAARPLSGGASGGRRRSSDVRDPWGE
jgi:serine/threonine-protein kinase